MENTREYITLYNLGAQLRLGFKKNMTFLADQFKDGGLIDDRCHESVTSPRSMLDTSDKAREMWKSVMDQVKLSTTYYNVVRSVLAASKVHAALVRQMDAEYQHQGGIVADTLANQPLANQPLAGQPLAVQGGSHVWTKKVDMATLSNIKYYDTNNKKAVLKLLENMAPDWADIGTLIGFTPAGIANVQQEAGKANQKNIDVLIAKWMKNAPGMPKWKRYPNTWQGLYNMLEDSSNTDLAEQLKAAINATHSDFHDTFENGMVGQQPVPAQQHQVEAAQVPGAVGQQQVPAQQPQVAAAQEQEVVVDHQQVPAQQSQVVVPQDFSIDFNFHQLFQWARSKELLHEEDYKIITGQQINGRAFTMLNEDYMKEFGFSLAGRMAILSILKEIKEEKTDSSVSSDGVILNKLKLFFGKKSSVSPPECYTEESIEAMDRGSHMPLLKLGTGNEVTRPDVEREVYIPPSEVTDYYDMTAKKHGVCFIINNKVFKNKQKFGDRLGTERDEYNLIQTWKYMGYRVEVRRNVTAAMMKKFFEEIDPTLENIKQEDPSLAHDSFVCCILSHGEKHCIFGYDGEAVQDTEIEIALGKSETLSNRPKLLFIQACQGNELGPELIESDSEPKRIQHKPIQQFKPDAVQNVRADFFISHSTSYGNVSYRDEKRGSIYIQVLCKILCDSSKKGPLTDLRMVLNREVPKIVVVYKDHEYRQQCSGEDTLSSRVHFFLELPKEK